jgi:hypothetical protein
MLQANEAGQKHFHTKGVRTVKLDKSVLLPEINKATHVYINSHPSLAFTLDKPRFVSIFNYISHGIYYHHYHQKYSQGNFRVCPLFIIPGLNEVPYLARIKEVKNLKNRLLIHNIFEQNSKYGDNPNIFYYQVQEGRCISEVVFRFVFYDGIEIITTSETQKGNLESILIDGHDP